MSDNKPVNDWVKDWEALQRQYLTAWSELAQKAPYASAAASPFAAPAPGAMPGIPPWHEGLEQWSRLFAGASRQGETVERLVESGKSYIAMIKGMLGAGAGGAVGETSAAKNWFEAMRAGFTPPAGFEMPGFDESLANNPFFKAVRDIAGQGASGFGELPAAFAPFLQQFNQEGLSWLRVPAFGFAREHQEHYQRTAVAFVDYQQALRNYNTLLLKASERGFALLEDKLAERSEPGRAIDSPRALYDLWVDAAEEAYAEIALSDEFAKAYGELANTQMRMRAQVHAEVERIGTDLGMPTRTELNSVHQRLHDLRREFRETREARANDAVAELERQLVDLQFELNELKAATARPPARATAVRAAEVAASELPQAAAKKPAAKKKSAAKKTAAKKEPAKKEAIAKNSVAKGPTAPARVAHKPVKHTAPEPPPVVHPKPATKVKAAKDEPRASFGDAIAAMRRRVARTSSKPRLKAVAAQLSKPAKAERAKKKTLKS